MPIQNDAYLHRREAFRLLNDPYANGETASTATAYALLAIEQRLGELVEQQRLGNTIAAFQSRAVRSDEDYVTALATVRGLLGIITEGDRA